jgi:putative transposase
MGLKNRGLQGVERVISNDHAGLNKAIEECLCGAAWQRWAAALVRHPRGSLPITVIRVLVGHRRAACDNAYDVPGYGVLQLV